MNNTFYHLKTYRERSGIALQDMAEIIGIDIASLSKIEKGKRKPPLSIVLSYHFILSIPIEKLCKNKYAELLKENTLQAVALKDRLLEAMTGPNISDRIKNIDAIIDQLVSTESQYASK
ncbi:helix-turn-helix transcriptional regulator [uncultured Dokdonia sp.]|uniref:helix-turn-helix domain-containing protein n=1 Tax=uncultured Dokdonia sp. TaxID=575653 RepID=UPI002628D92B|nr:helix-turn-helix transcriptional regulator [uncultured Dokdonia sp.]